MMNCGRATSMNAALNIPRSETRDRFARWSAGVSVAIVAATFLFNVAPYWQVNPQYSFGYVDAIAQRFQGTGIQPAFLVSDAPQWAETPGRQPDLEHDGAWEPDASDRVRPARGRCPGWVSCSTR